MRAFLRWNEQTPGDQKASAKSELVVFVKKAPTQKHGSKRVLPTCPLVLKADEEPTSSPKVLNMTPSDEAKT